MQCTGIYGVYAANTYLELHPEANIKVLDSDEDAGGIWSTSHLYPQFWSQTGARLSGYPDVPFKLPEGAETYYDLFEAKHLAKYVEAYVTDHKYDGRELRDKFVFRCYVTGVEKAGDGIWTIRADREGQQVTYRASKVIIATRLSSVPNMPDLPGKEAFKGAVLHQKAFGHSRVLTAEEADMEDHAHVTILGGSKSATDIAYTAATDPNHPRKVNWIIRTSGSGPLVFSNAKGFGKYRNIPETGSTRAIASLSSANPYLPESWWSWFLHKTFVGEWLLEKIWRRIERESPMLADFYGREGRLEGFEGLKSESNVRWRAGPLGLMQRDDFWDVIARNVRIYRQDIARLTEETVVLEDETEVRTDVCSAGRVGSRNIRTSAPRRLQDWDCPSL